jgi:hypothetical protein
MSRSVTVEMSPSESDAIGRALDYALDHSILGDEFAALAFMFSPDDLEDKAARRFQATRRAYREDDPPPPTRPWTPVYTKDRRA